MKMIIAHTNHQFSTLFFWQQNPSLCVIPPTFGDTDIIGNSTLFYYLTIHTHYLFFYYFLINLLPQIHQSPHLLCLLNLAQFIFLLPPLPNHRFIDCTELVVQWIVGIRVLMITCSKSSAADPPTLIHMRLAHVNVFTRGGSHKQPNISESVQEEVERTQKGGPYKVKAATPTAVQVKGKTMWYHLNHCRRVTKVSAKREGGEERPASQNNKVQGLEILGGGVEEGKQENEGNKLVGMSDACHIPDDKSSYSQYPLI
ncbi:hypothetical protein Q7C36_005229 [Tachysurus vachellii]|uniref:Uncharacterized protein n=1 Tax=Tachysurus vachellii TaxID=175792 RepID=A0AA88T6Q1_TACVA|nr:hypothetical protein Q7C36_005229 [Tachysurus vachellii]